MAKIEMSDCPSCGGFGDHGVEEESGCLYVCYCCGGSGLVPESMAIESKRAAAWAFYVESEKHIRERARLGVPHGYSYYFDEYDGELVLVPPRGARVPPPLRCIDGDDDIPF